MNNRTEQSRTEQHRTEQHNTEQTRENKTRKQKNIIEKMKNNAEPKKRIAKEGKH